MSRTQRAFSVSVLGAVLFAATCLAAAPTIEWMSARRSLGEAIDHAKSSEDFAAVPSGNSHLKKAIAFMELAREELEAAGPNGRPLTQ